MKIAFINSVYKGGSTGHIIFGLSNLVRETGMESKVFFGYGNSSGEHATRISSDLYVKINILKTRFLGKHSFYSKSATRKLIRMLEAFSPDLIHIHQVHGHYLNVPILFSYFANQNKPIIWTMHDCWAFTGHCAHFDFINCNKWINGCYDCPQLNTYPVSKIFDRSRESWRDKKKFFTMPKNMTITTPSNWLKTKLEQSYFKDFDIITINNGINVNLFRPIQYDNLKKTLPIKNDFVILGMYSKWFDPRISSLTMPFIEKIRDDFQIILIGGTTKQNNNLPKGVMGIPFIKSKEEMAMYFSLSDVFVNLTLEDTFPTVNIESLACGTPVITFNSGGSPEILSEEVGAVVDRLDFESIVVLLKAMRNKEISFSSSQCRERALKNYDETELYKKYIQLYSEKKQAISGQS